MNEQEFKIKYPEYSHLEGDELWDMMTTVLGQIGEQKDTNEFIEYVDNSGHKWHIEKSVEDFFKHEPTYKTESYKLILLDLGKDLKLNKWS